jgi:Domain of unknown function (DUF4202)
MSHQLDLFSPSASEHVKLAARCQHIGRWEIPRSSYPMDQKGYFKWRNELKSHHASIAASILQTCGYDASTIEKVKFLLLKKELHLNRETQLLEDVICLVFLEYYLDEFAAKHEDGKVVDILRKTMKKMSASAIEAANKIPLSPKAKQLLQMTKDE